MASPTQPQRSQTSATGWRSVRSVFSFPPRANTDTFAPSNKSSASKRPKDFKMLSVSVYALDLLEFNNWLAKRFGPDTEAELSGDRYIFYVPKNEHLTRADKAKIEAMRRPSDEDE